MHISTKLGRKFSELHIWVMNSMNSVSYMTYYMNSYLGKVVCSGASAIAFQIPIYKVKVTVNIKTIIMWKGTICPWPTVLNRQGGLPRLASAQTDQKTDTNRQTLCEKKNMNLSCAFGLVEITTQCVCFCFCVNVCRVYLRVWWCDYLCISLKYLGILKRRLLLSRRTKINCPNSFSSAT